MNSESGKLDGKENQKEENLMAIQFDGIKNERPIICTSMLHFSSLLWLENDENVISYFDPQMSLVAPHEGTDYSIPIHVWVRRVSDRPAFIGIVDAETEQLFERHPEVLANVREHARSINAEYVPIRKSDSMPVWKLRPFRQDLDLWEFVETQPKQEKLLSTLILTE